MTTDLSMEAKWEMIQKLLAPSEKNEGSPQPIVLALKPFDPDEITDILIIDARSSVVTTINKKGTVEQEAPTEKTIYIGYDAVNYLTKEQGWKISSMMLISRPGDRYGEFHHEFITVLVLPKKTGVGDNSASHRLDLPLMDFFTTDRLHAFGSKSLTNRALCCLMNEIASRKDSKYSRDPIDTLGEFLANMTRADLLRIPHMGKYSVELIMKVLNKEGLGLPAK